MQGAVSSSSSSSSSSCRRSSSSSSSRSRALVAPEHHLWSSGNCTGCSNGSWGPHTCRGC
jgi:hypothetical protein